MRAFILTLILTATCPADLNDDFSAKLVAFNRPYALFVREYIGCPDRALTPQECAPIRGKLNRRLFEQSREAAKKLFDLREPQ